MILNLFLVLDFQRHSINRRRILRVHLLKLTGSNTHLLLLTLPEKLLSSLSLNIGLACRVCEVSRILKIFLFFESLANSYILLDCLCLPIALNRDLGWRLFAFDSHDDLASLLILVDAELQILLV